MARRLGFETWRALKAGADAMTTDVPQTASQPILTSTEAQLFVADIKASCDFFTTKLGFATVFTHGNPPFYGQVRWRQARLNLRRVDGPVFVDGIRERETLLSATMTVASAAETERLFLELQASGVGVHQSLRREPWGARTFIVEDPDGNLLLFAGPDG